MRGVNFGGWFSQIDAIEQKDPRSFLGIDAHMRTFLGDADFRQVAGWGFDHVRLPIDAYIFFDEAARPIASRLGCLDRAVDMAAAHHLSLVIDLHECPGHDFHDGGENAQALFFDSAKLNQTLRIWACLAERYATRSHVLFELLNEPVAPDGDTWNRVRDDLFAEVRRHASARTVIFGSNMWNWPSTFSQLTPVDDDNAMYCFHFYEPLLFTHQLAPWLKEPEFQQSRPYPADYENGVTRMYGLRMSQGYWDRARMEREVAPVLQFAHRYQAAVVCNEFGTYVRASRGHQLAWLADFLSVLRNDGIGFSYWNYKNLDFGIISQGERLHRDLPQYQNALSMDAELLALLQA